FRNVVRYTVKQLMEQKKRFTVIALASQCRQLDDATLADELVVEAMKGLSDKETLSITLAGIEYYWQSGQQAKADEVLQALLKTDKGSANASLWRLASAMATKQRKLGRAVACLDKALEIDYRHLPKLINLQVVRADYSQLLGAYQQVAHAHSMLDTPIDK